MRGWLMLMLLFFVACLVDTLHFVAIKRIHGYPEGEGSLILFWILPFVLTLIPSLLAFRHRDYYGGLGLLIAGGCLGAIAVGVSLVMAFVAFKGGAAFP